VALPSEIEIFAVLLVAISIESWGRRDILRRKNCLGLEEVVGVLSVE
jgi:hypothetical protein